MPQESRRSASSVRREDTTARRNRLSVEARNVNTFTYPEETKLDRLTNALRNIQPDLAHRAETERQDLFEEQRRAGAHAARDPDAELDGSEAAFFQQEFMRTKGSLDAREAGRQIEAEYATFVDKDDPDIDGFLGLARQNAIQGIDDPDYLETFNKELDITFNNIRDDFYVHNVEIVKEETSALVGKQTTELVSGFITLEEDLQTPELLRDELQVIYQEGKAKYGMEFNELDDAIIPSIMDAAIKTANPDLLDVFYINKPGGLPGAAYTNKWKARIRQAQQEAQNNLDALETLKQKEIDDAKEEQQDAMVKRALTEVAQTGSVNNLVELEQVLDPTQYGKVLSALKSGSIIEDSVFVAQLRYDISVGNATADDVLNAVRQERIDADTATAMFDDLDRQSSGGSTSIFKSDGYKFGEKFIKGKLKDDDNLGFAESEIQVNALRMYRERVAALGDGVTDDQLFKVADEVVALFPEGGQGESTPQPKFDSLTDLMNANLSPFETRLQVKALYERGDITDQQMEQLRQADPLL